jgi:hypothetical protein
MKKRAVPSMERCFFCSTLTMAAEVIELGSWRVHMPACLPCTMFDWPPGTCPLVVPLHRAPLSVLLRAIFYRRFIWTFDESDAPW